MATVTEIKACAATTCAFNNDGCTAPGITVNSQSGCATFISLDVRSAQASGSVAVCQRLECVFNKDLACTNSAVDFTAQANCASFEAR